MLNIFKKYYLKGQKDFKNEVLALLENRKIKNKADQTISSDDINAYYNLGGYETDIAVYNIGKELDFIIKLISNNLPKE